MSMQTIVNNNLLKHAAGHAIFCPQCQAILDWKRTVLLTVRFNGKEKSFTRCLGCWKLEEPNTRVICNEKGFELEVITK